MAETTTLNYGWTMPDPGASANTWGATLNATTQKIDAQVFANQQAITAGQAPIGSITMFGGATPPTGWLLCNGQSLSTAAPYDKLFAAIQYAHGGSGANFNLPNIQGVFPFGASGPNVGSQGGSFSYTLDVAHLPPHAHPITDVAHSHSASQNAHNHVVTTGNHSHTLSTGGHAHSGVATGLTGPGTGSIAGGVGGGNLQMGNTSTAGNLGGNTDTAGNLGGNTDTQQPGVTVNASGTGLSTTQNAGSGSAISIVPSYVALNFIIRYQ